MLEVLKTYCHSGDRDHFTAASMFMQRLLGHICGFEDLVDHDLLGQDQGFLAALGAEQCASSSTICRFENSARDNIKSRTTSSNILSSRTYSLKIP